MARLPWTDATGPARPGDEGGMEHLETDVMRFMAILAFCLVAIFALVQSVPQPTREPPAVAEAQPVEPPPPAPSVADAEFAEPRSVAPPKPQADIPELSQAATAMPVAEAPEAPVTFELETPAPDTEVADVPPSVADTETPDEPDVPEAAPRGFSLRFDSDAALVGLVERDEVDLYAFARDRVWQFMIVDGRPTFRSAQAPRQFHEMAADTVPHQVVAALRRTAVLPGGGVKWGVTLPAPTAAVLARVLATASGGDLVIDADGFLHLEEST